MKASTELISGFGAPASHYGNRSTGYIGEAVGRQLTLLLEIVHHWPCQDDHVGGLAIENALFQIGGQTVPDG